jgi:hypothetical protein
MPGWLHRLLGRAAALEPLRGTPAVRRMKNYAAETGYAYEYYYEGWRPSSGGERHVFSISGDRKNWATLEVRLERHAVERWEAAHAVKLHDRERYAVVKLALFEAFDGRATPREAAAPVLIDAAAVERYLERLGIG